MVAKISKKIVINRDPLKRKGAFLINGTRLAVTDIMYAMWRGDAEYLELEMDIKEITSAIKGWLEKNLHNIIDTIWRGDAEYLELETDIKEITSAIKGWLEKNLHNIIDTIWEVEREIKETPPAIEKWIESKLNDVAYAMLRYMLLRYTRLKLQMTSAIEEEVRRNLYNTMYVVWKKYSEYERIEDVIYLRLQITSLTKEWLIRDLFNVVYTELEKEVRKEAKRIWRKDAEDLESQIIPATEKWLRTNLSQKTLNSLFRCISKLDTDGECAIKLAKAIELLEAYLRHKELTNLRELLESNRKPKKKSKEHKWLLRIDELFPNNRMEGLEKYISETDASIKRLRREIKQLIEEKI